MSFQDPIEHTRRWISSIVIGLNLCPFAERVFQADTIRYAVSNASEPAALLVDLAGELQRIVSSSRESIETTFLIHPKALIDFFEYNDFLGAADDLVHDMELRGTIQIVGFHPNYQFKDSLSDAVENYTNRSPYPMLHLLREQSISEVATKPDELLKISKRNIKTLNRLGTRKILQKLKNCALLKEHLPAPKATNSVKPR